MTRDEILKMALYCNLVDNRFVESIANQALLDRLSEFAELVADKEREECAVIAWTVGMDLHMKQYDAREIGSACARAIRERNN